MKSNILEMEFSNKIEVSKETAFWNYWDHEHLDIVHEGYKVSDILYDANNFMFRIDDIKIPKIPFLTIKTPVFMVQHNENILYTYAIQFGVISKTTISIYSLSQKSCKIKMNYKFYLNGWRKILRPFLKKLIPIWNNKVWLEDLPIKLRREKVKRLNFKDFYGLPDDLNDRNYDGKLDFKLPIKRPKNSSRDKHPLKK